MRSVNGGWRRPVTITQQLARNVFLNSNRTLDRKLREAVLAMALEWNFSKQQILELYLNKVYFGGGAYGIDSASRKFFSHSAHRTVAVRSGDHCRAGQGAVSRYSPTADAEAAVGRAEVVLEQMVRYGGISAGEVAGNRCFHRQSARRGRAEFGALFHRLGAAAA